jgi:hypothetical protein
LPERATMGETRRFRPFDDTWKSVVDVIVTVDTPPTQAAQQATSTIPIVIAVSADPVAAGLVQSLGYPGGNSPIVRYKLDAVIDPVCVVTAVQNHVPSGGFIGVNDRSLRYQRADRRYCRTLSRGTTTGTARPSRLLVYCRRHSGQRLVPHRLDASQTRPLTHRRPVRTSLSEISRGLELQSELIVAYGRATVTGMTGAITVAGSTEAVRCAVAGCRPDGRR